VEFEVTGAGVLTRKGQRASGSWPAQTRSSDANARTQGRIDTSLTWCGGRLGRRPEGRSMALPSGSRLGAYEIQAPLGAGGPAFADRSLRSQLRRVHRSHERTAR